MNPDCQLIVIGGPTAVGKTALAIALAQELDTEIVSADSRQIYRQLNIGVGRPSPEELAAVPHHLIGYADIHQHYHAADFEQDALRVLDEIYSRQNTAILCGGTGLYIQTLCDGIDDIPSADPVIRQQLEERFLSEGIGFLQDFVREKDPDLVPVIDMQNPKRLIRAVEVCLQTGERYSSFRKGKKATRNFSPRFFCLHTERAQLYGNIRKRVLQMLQDGWVEEARELLPYQTLKALHTVGYRELFDYLEGKVSYQDTIELIVTHTCQYARRQLTWFRRDPRFHWVTSLEEVRNSLKGISL